MDAMKLKIYGDVIKLSIEKNYSGNLKTCKITEQGEYIFSDNYLNKNYNLLHLYLTPIIEKNKISKIILQEKNFISKVINLLNIIPTIKSIVIEEDIELNIRDKKNLIELKYIKEIDCYDLDLNIYYELETKYNKKIYLRSEILFQSSFMIENNIDTVSKLYQTKEVIVDKMDTTIDKEEFEHLLNNNKYLNKIIIKNYSKELVEYLNVVTKNKNILISILNDNNLKETEYHFLKEMKRKNNLKLELEYTKQYKEKNVFKQLNVNLLRICMVLIIFVCVGFVSTEHYIFEKDKKEVEKQEVKYEEIIEEVIPEEEVKVEEEVIIQQVPVEQTPVYISPYYQTYSEQISELKAINSDTVGWIRVNNTNVNYPVVKTNNNDYYLNHSFDKTVNTFGWIYADYRSNFDSLNQNTIIYGHNVQGTNLLFSTLINTLNASWYNNANNLVLTFNTEKENISWQIFSIYLTPVTNDYLITNFNNQESFLNFVQKLKDRSIKDFGVEIIENDKILTLSTCYKDSTQRVVIHAKKIS